MSISPIFTFNLNQKILPGLVTLGKYGDQNSSLTAVTTSNKIYIRNLKTAENKSVSHETTHTLNFTQPITNIAAVKFNNEESDVLLICTKSRIYAYNVQQNQDIFTKDVTDGGNVVEYGKIGTTELVFVGGNCSVQGFDINGVEQFWIVTGDNVRSLALTDIDNDGDDELIVGSDDYDIRIFKNDELLHEITETQIVTHLLNLGNGFFAYTLANGTVGVYEKLNRLWRVKSKNRASYLYKYDINGDGIVELITGWHGGKVDGRNTKTGEVIFKDNFEHTIAGICEGDCRDTGKNDLIVVSITGDIKGYNPYAPKPMRKKTTELNYEQETIRELLSRKQGLLLELKNYQCNSKNVGMKVDENHYSKGVPAKTRLQTTIGVTSGSDTQPPHVEVGLSTNNDTIIRTAIVFAEGIFKGETHVEHPKLSEVCNKLNISLYPSRDVPIDIHIKALVGYLDSNQFHVFELTRHLPRFAMYTTMNRPADASSSVSFTLNERIQRVMLWINRNFLLTQPLDINTSTDLKLHLISLRDNKEASLYMDQSGKMKIHTDNITLAGDLIQSLAAYLNLEHLKSNADFPKEEEKCIELLEKLKELELVKGKLNLDLGDKSNLIKNLLIRGEDARLLGDWKLMKQFYIKLNDLNENLQNDYKIRSSNYNEILSTMKEINSQIQKASRLRYGKYKTDPVVLCRKAIISNNVKSLIKAIRVGEV